MWRNNQAHNHISFFALFLWMLCIEGGEEAFRWFFSRCCCCYFVHRCASFTRFSLAIFSFSISLGRVSEFYCATLNIHIVGIFFTNIAFSIYLSMCGVFLSRSVSCSLSSAFVLSFSLRLIQFINRCHMAFLFICHIPNHFDVVYIKM